MVGFGTEKEGHDVDLYALVVEVVKAATKVAFGERFVDWGARKHGIYCAFNVL